MNHMRLSIFFSVFGLLAILSSIALKASFGVSAQTSGSSVVTVSAASYAATLAPEAIASAFGVKLATSTGIAASFPLPVTLAGTTVTVNGEAAPLFFVSPSQINFLIPLGIPAGAARVIVTTGDGTVSTGSVQIAPVAPALFTANADGQGPLASLLLRIKTDGQASYETLAQYDGAKFVSRPIQYGAESDQLFLVLYLTGIRQAAKENVRVSLGGVEYDPLFVGAAGGLIGLDQINLALPRNFEGRGRITLLVKAAGAGASNSGEFSIGAVAASSDMNAPLQLIGGLEQPLLAGEEVEIRGAGFAANPRENLVQIIANDGVTAKAEVLTVSADSLRVRVPFGASTGQLRVSRNQAEASLPVRVRTSISGFVEEVRQLGTGPTQRFPLSGIRVKLRNAPNIESLTNADGSYILADVTTSFNEIEINPPGGNLNFPTVKFKARALADRDNQIERSTELRSIGNNAAVSLAHIESLTAPEAVLTFLLPGRTPANLPRTHFSTSIAQLTPFGESLVPSIRLSFPNSDALPAASRPRLFKFDQQTGSPTLGEFVDIGEAVVTSDGQRVETAANAITEGSYYFVSTARPTAAVSGRVVESDGRPVPRAIVQARGQSVFTDGYGGFVLRDVPVMSERNDKLKVEVSYQRPNGNIARKDSSEVVLTEGALATVSPDVVLDASVLNIPPVLLLPSNLTMEAGETREFDSTAIDPDSAQVPQVSLSGNAASFTTLSNPSAGIYRLRIAANANAAGTYSLSLTARDGAGAQVTRSTTLLVTTRSASVPVAQTQVITLAEDIPRAVTLAGRDPNGLSLRYTLTSQPARGSLSGVAPNLTYSPRADFNGVDSFTYKVNNGSADSEIATVHLIVSPVNDTPILNLPTTLAVTAGTALSLVVTATDVDSEARLNFVATGLPTGAGMLELAGNTRVLNWTPLVQQMGTHRISITVTDSGVPARSDTKTLVVVVNGKWAKTSGPEGLSIDAFLLHNRVVYAGGDGGIYRSTDNGLSWAIASKGIIDPDVHALAVIGNTVFAGTDREGVYRSSDGGASWGRVSQGLTNSNIQSLGVRGNTLYAGTLGGGMFRSDNLGDSWVAVRSAVPANSWVKDFTLQGDTLFAATRGNGIFRSTDGQNWVAVNAGLTNLDVLTLTAMGGTVFAGNWQGGLHRSVNNGATWVPINNGLTSNRINRVTAVGNKLFVHPFASRLYLSTDNGNSWRFASEGLTQGAAEPIIGNEEFLIVGTPVGTFRSANTNTLRWVLSNNGQTSPLTSALAFNGETLFAAGFGSGIHRTFNTGASWSRKDLGTNFLTSVLAAEGVVYAGCWVCGVARSTNNGESWEAFATASAGISLAVNDSGVVFVGGQESEIHRSTDKGRTWQRVGNVSTASVRVAHLLWFDGALHASTGGAGVLRSTDNGISWQAINTGLNNRETKRLAVYRNTLHVGTNGTGIFRLTGNPARWEAVSTGLTGLNVEALAVDGDFMYAGTVGNGIFWTANGTTWTPLSDGLADSTVYDIVVREHTVYAATTGGVYKLFNNTQVWSELNQGVNNRSLNALAVSESGWLIGTLGSGVFRSTNRGQSWTSANAGLPANANIQSVVTSNNTSWAATQGDGIYRSTDQGVTWGAVNNGLANKFVNKLFLSGGTLYAGTDGGVFRSVDGGNNWTAVNAGLSNLRAVSFALNDGVLWVGTDGGGVFRLSAEGSSWLNRSNGLTSSTVTALGVAGGALYAGTINGGIFLSRDGGDTWKAANNQLPPTLAVSAFAATGRKLYAGTVYGVFLSEDEGQSWKQINAGLLNIFVTGLAVSGDQLYASTASGGVFVSRIPSTP